MCRLVSSVKWNRSEQSPPPHPPPNKLLPTARTTSNPRFIHDSPKCPPASVFAHCSSDFPSFSHTHLCCYTSTPFTVSPPPILHYEQEHTDSSCVIVKMHQNPPLLSAEHRFVYFLVWIQTSRLLCDWICVLLTKYMPINNRPPA